MNKQETARRTRLLENAKRGVAAAWEKFGRIYGSRRIGTLPTVALNGRLSKTAAWVYLDRRHIEVSIKLYSEFPAEYHAQTFPHECAHLVANTIYGDPNHGRGWKTVMREYGIEPLIYHDMCAKLEAREQIKRLLKDCEE